MTEQLMDNMDDLTYEEHEALLLMSEHGIAAPLSPAAQAVLDATGRKAWYRNNDIAAALRAAADQVVPPEQKTPWGSVIQAHAAELRIRNELLAIAAELEALANG